MKQMFFRAQTVGSGKLLISDSILTQTVNGKRHIWLKSKFWEEVIPETIVDFTGLCDKHGKKIFTGDIIHIKCGYGLSAFVGNGIVFFDEKRLQFRVRSVEPSSFDSEKGNIYDECDFTVIDGYEVIGNIYSNHELLGEL